MDESQRLPVPAMTPGAPSMVDRNRLLEMADDDDGGAAHGTLPIYFSWPGSGSFEFVNKAANDRKSEIVGVVVVSRLGRTLYAKTYTGGKDRPICSSNDGVHGSNAEVCQSKLCRECPKAKWGTGKDGKGSACRESRRLVIVTKRDEPPIILTVPVTSIRAWDSYCNSLRTDGRRYYSVISKLSLGQAESRTGMGYAGLQTKAMRDLSDEHLAWVVSSREHLIQLVATGSGDPEEMDGEEAGQGTFTQYAGEQEVPLGAMADDPYGAGLAGPVEPPLPEPPLPEPPPAPAPRQAPAPQARPTAPRPVQQAQAPRRQASPPPMSEDDIPF
jgi:hypothetical protein